MRCVVLLMNAALLLVLPELVSAQETAPAKDVEPDFGELVERLGATGWPDRVSAAQRLTVAGENGTRALQVGLSHQDAEVRRRCRLLLAERIRRDIAAGAEALKAEDFEQRIGSHSLPGWERYRKEIGSDRESRMLFAEMLSAESALLMATRAGGKVTSNAVNARVRQVMSGLYNRISSERRVPTKGTVAAVIFAAAHPDVEDRDGLLNGQWLSTLAQQSSFTSSLRATPPSQAALKILAMWLRGPANEKADLQRLRIAVTYQAKTEGLKLALRILADAKGTNPSVVAMAFEAVARFGGVKYSRVLVPFLADQRSCGARIVGGNRIQVQLQDVVMVWLVWMNGQDPGQYNQATAKRYLAMLKSSPNRTTSASYFYFKSKEARQEALAKWADWMKENPLPQLPSDVSVEPAREKPEPVLDTGPAEPENTPGRQVQEVAVADRLRMQMLRRAQTLLDEKPGHLEAIALIGRLLSEDRDWIFRTDGETPVYRTLRSEAEDVISRLTPGQLDLYEQQFGRLARADFDRAMVDGTQQSFMEIVRKYYFTRAGADAAWWLGAMQIDRGQFFPAALWLSRLRRTHPLAEQFEPMLSLLLAFCWHESGVADRAVDSLDVLRESGRKSVKIFGTDRLLPARRESEQWLIEVFAGHGSRRRPVTGSGQTWTAIRQRPVRKTRIDAGYDAAIEQALKTVEDMHDQFGVAAIPQLKPVIVGGAVVFRTLTELRCVDLASGKTRWQSAVLNGLNSLLPVTGLSKSPGITLARAVREQLWERSVASSLVTDGQRIFAVEDVAPRSGGVVPQLEILPDGTPTLREGIGKSHNRLTAWDVRTGKVLWECGGPGSASALSDASAKEFPPHSATDSEVGETATRALAGVGFIGAPQPLGDQMCIAGRDGDQIKLFLIDSATGQLVWQSTLHVADEPMAMRQVMPFGKSSTPAFNTAGSAAVLSDDSIFVYVGANRYVAFDLAMRRILWAYEEQRNHHPGPVNVRNINLIQQFASRQMTAPDRWIHTRPIVADDRVLITPPHTDLLVCLDRDSGRVVWDRPRDDGLFVAGVVEGVAVVVGRAAVQGIRVADGRPAWSQSAVSLPGGIQPVGQGLLIPDVDGKHSELHLPQANGRVAVLDLAAGRWTTSSWHINGPAGNLSSGSTTVVSQDVHGVTVFDRTDNQRERILARLAASPRDTIALTAAAELALHEGQIDQAVEYATRAVRAGGDDKAESSLATAIAAAVRQIQPGERQSEQQLLPLLDLLSSSKDQARILRTIADLQTQRGDRQSALETWLRLISSRTETSSYELLTQSFGWKVREDCWMRVRLEGLFESAADDEWKAMTDRLLQLRKTIPPAVYVRFFRFHPSAHYARLQLAETHAENKAWIAAEQLLMEVADSGSPEQQVTATWRLAELLQAGGRSVSARWYARRLAGALAEVTDDAGRTGRELSVSLLAKVADPLRDASAWPIGPVQVKEFKVSTEERSRMTTGYALLSEHRPDSVQSGTVELDSRLNSLSFRDAFGREEWKVTLKEPVTSSVRYLRYAVRYNQSRSSQVGQATFAWIGDQVCAVDGFAGSRKLIWSESCFVANPLDPVANQFRPQFRPKVMIHQDAQKLPLLVTSTGVCFQRGRKLLAVDPLSGETLWWRDDLPAGCDLFGDSQFVFVRTPGETTAVVLRGSDGKKIGTREVPPIGDRVLLQGRQCISSSVNGQVREVIARDLWSRKILWKKLPGNNSHLSVLNGREIAILDTDGRFQVIEIKTGLPAVDVKLNVPQTIANLLVLRRADRFVVVVNEPQKAKVPGRMIAPSSSTHRNVHGELYILSETGEELSQSRFEEQAIKLNQPERLPLLVLYRRYQQKNQGANGRISYSRAKTRLVLLDLRSGRTVHQFDREFGSDVDYRLAADPLKHQLTLKTRTVGITIDYSGQKAGGVK